MVPASLVLLLAAQPVGQVMFVGGGGMVVWGPGGPNQAADPAAAASDEQILKNAHLDLSGPGLLAFFRKRATPAISKDQLAALANQLRDKSPAVHDKACAELIAWGPRAVPTLRRVANHIDDEDTSIRARKCLESIEGRGGSELVQSALRLLAVRNPAGSVEVLLTYLPWADDEAVVQELETALIAVGHRDGKPDAALNRALRDPLAVRRGIAARVLCQIGGQEGRAAVRPLLKDARPSVRMHAALGLAEAHDSDAMTVLIDLIAELPPEGCKQVESYLGELAGEWAIKTPQSHDLMAGRLRRDVWAAWWRGLDGSRLLEEFRSRTLSEADRTALLKLIQQLGDESLPVRARATEQIIDWGARAAPLLRQALASAKPRLAPRAKLCLDTIEGGSPRPLPDAAVRLLALRRPKGAVKAMLGYIPFAETDASTDQLIDLLASAGCLDGKADSELVEGLSEKLGIRRAAAAVALCKGKAKDAIPAVRKLLLDKEALVRMKTAMALVEFGDKTAMPVLIALLGELPMEQVWDVEDMLFRLAGDKSPDKRISDDKASRTASMDAWKKWWSKAEKTIDLAKLSSSTRDRGLLLVIENQGGRVLELSRTGQIRWEIKGLQWPQDAQVLANGHVLIVENNGMRVVERDRQGKEHWSVACNNACQAQRLRNGNTFVASGQSLHEFDSTGKEVFSRTGNGEWIIAGRKFNNGHMAYLTWQGSYVRVDATGKEVKSFRVPFRWQNGVMGAELLPNDRLVVSLGVGKVAEYGDAGKLIWEASINGAGAPHRLSNGRTLVPANNQSSLIELDRTGKVVSEKKDLNCRPYRVYRR